MYLTEVLLKKLDDKNIELLKNKIMKEGDDMLALARTFEREKREQYNSGRKLGLYVGEKRKQIEIVKNMLLKEVDVDLIEEVTKLKKSEIEKLKLGLA